MSGFVPTVPAAPASPAVSTWALSCAAALRVLASSSCTSLMPRNVLPVQRQAITAGGVSQPMVCHQ